MAELVEEEAKAWPGTGLRGRAIFGDATARLHPC
jgi:hypothetical protein